MVISETVELLRAGQRQRQGCARACAWPHPSPPDRLRSQFKTECKLTRPGRARQVEPERTPSGVAEAYGPVKLTWNPQRSSCRCIIAGRHWSGPSVWRGRGGACAPFTGGFSPLVRCSCDSARDRTGNL